MASSRTKPSCSCPLIVEFTLVFFFSFSCFCNNIPPHITKNASYHTSEKSPASWLTTIVWFTLFKTLLHLYERSITKSDRFIHLWVLGHQVWQIYTSLSAQSPSLTDLYISERLVTKSDRFIHLWALGHQVWQIYTSLSARSPSLTDLYISITTKRISMQTYFMSM